MRAISPSIPEKTFFATALSSSLRLDGRSLLQSRPVTITFGSNLGHVEISLGGRGCNGELYDETRVLAVVEATMVRPTPERPYEGVLNINAEMGPMAGVEYEAGRQSEDEIALVRMLDKVLRRSDVLDTESLCILAGQRVWHLRLTIHILSSNGSLSAAAALAGMIALRHMRLPEVESTGPDSVIVHPITSRAPVPLAIRHSAYAFVFGLYAVVDGDGDGGGGKGVKRTVSILDPAGLETRLTEGSMVVAVNAQKELCVVHKAGGVPLRSEEVMGLVNVAVREAIAMEEYVKARLKEDWEGRKTSVEVR